LKIGITLPSFAHSAAPVLARAREAEEAGIDGVFAFDHLWPGDDRSRPALSLYPTLGAVAAATTTIRVGSLVARLGLVPDEVVLESLLTLSELSGGRLVAALGVGDAKSRSENRAYGIAWPPPEARRASLARIIGGLAGAGIEAWVGATGAATLAVARDAGATVNLWEADLGRLRSEAGRGPTTWAGPLPREPGAAADRLSELSSAGASWAIWGWPSSIDLVTAALARAGIQAGRA
jgi:hypothetical protein